MWGEESQILVSVTTKLNFSKIQFKYIAKLAIVLKPKSKFGYNSINTKKISVKGLFLTQTNRVEVPYPIAKHLVALIIHLSTIFY
ncbi:hypothetical protein FGF1_36250 [Flavobacteriaceae bacterium GF1]